MSSPADLPDDIAALKALVAERDAALAHKEVVVTELREQLSTRSAEIEHLKLWIAKHAAHAVWPQVGEARHPD